MKRSGALALAFILGLVWAPVVCAQAWKSEGTALVGRITFIEGQLLRYVPDVQDWVATVKDAPFGMQDAVYSSDTGKAEFKLPNGVWVRTGSDTQIQLIALCEDLTEVDAASGTVRFYNKSQKNLVKATTPFGYVLAKPGAAFDLYVGDDSAEVTSLDGAVDLVLGEGETRYPVEAGGASVVSDGKAAVEGDGQVDTAWDEWNLNREELWTERVHVKGDSVDNLPYVLRDDAYDLDRYGRWEKVYYEGQYRKLWRPTVVAADWQPFTVGRWTVWSRDNVWIPEEPFGYVTHHYGNWVFVNSHWYWTPPVKTGAGNIVRHPYWYPGRVSWIHSDADVGWVPLAPSETYYAHNYWGPGSLVAGAGRAASGADRLAYAGHAVVIPRGRLYSVNSYSGIKVANINRAAVIGRFRTAPVISDRVMPNYSSNHNRYIYNMDLAHLAAKPHQDVADRINRNLSISPGTTRRISAFAVQRELARMGRGQPVKDPNAAQRVQRFRVTSRIVPENQVHRPRSEVQFIEHTLKAQRKPPQRRPGLYRPGLYRPGLYRPGALPHRSRY